MKLINFKIDIFKAIFLITLILFVFNGTSVISIVNSRVIGGFILMLSLYLFIRKSLFKCFNANLLIIYFLFITWCIFTSLWANNFNLTFEKSLALGLTSLIFSSAGFEWVKRYGWKNAINWLSIIVLITLVAAVSGEFNAHSSYLLASGANLYAGVIGGGSANIFGFFCAISFPLLLWKFQSKNIGWMALIIIDLFYLLRSGSRSAVLIVLSIAVFWLLSLKVMKKILIITLVSLISSYTIFTYSSIFKNIVYKGAIHTTLFETRQAVWEMSYLAATEGGWVGVGYSGFVSLKDTGLLGVTNKWMYHESDHSREKGNSQLASIEETGIIGLGLHCAFLLAFFVPAIKFWNRTKNQQKVMFGIILGSIIGLLVESVFESWWSGPFSAENAIFWLLLGVARGCMTFMNNEPLS